MSDQITLKHKIAFHALTVSLTLNFAAYVALKHYGIIEGDLLPPSGSISSHAVQLSHGNTGPLGLW